MRVQFNKLQQKHVEEEVSVVSNQLEEEEDDEQRGLVVDYDEEDLLNLQVFYSIM